MYLLKKRNENEKEKEVFNQYKDYSQQDWIIYSYTQTEKKKRWYWQNSNEIEVLIK